MEDNEIGPVYVKAKFTNIYSSSAVVFVSFFINDVLVCGGYVGSCDGNGGDALRDW